MKREPIVIAGGKGALLVDTKGKEFWTPTLPFGPIAWPPPSGHQCRHYPAAGKKYLFHLGFANEPASLLGAQLIGLAAAWPRQKLRRVFYSDDVSTAMEAGLKWRPIRSTHREWPSEIPFSGFRLPRRHHRRGQSRPHRPVSQSLSRVAFQNRPGAAPYCYRDLLQPGSSGESRRPLKQQVQVGMRRGG